MSLIAGIDYSTHAVDVVLLDEDSDRAEWHRFDLWGSDAFERTRAVRNGVPRSMFWDDVLAVGIEEPRGHNAGLLYRIQGALLCTIPGDKLVQPWVPSAWRKAVGLPGNCTKTTVAAFSTRHRVAAYANRVHLDPAHVSAVADWPQDACDAYCIALATRNALQKEEAAA